MAVGNYIDLTKSDTRLDMARIERNESECRLFGPKGNACRGFILARSRAGRALTICDLDFHLSNTDGTYPARLPFAAQTRTLPTSRSQSIALSVLHFKRAKTVTENSGR